MLGKIIILLIAVLLAIAMLYRFASSLGLVRKQPLKQKKEIKFAYKGFQFTKFNIAMLCLVGIYLLWGITQFLR